MQPFHIAVLVIYIVAMVALGTWFSRGKRTSTGEDFVLAGRSLPAPVLGGTMLATFVGSGSIIGGANFAYTYGPFAGLLFFSGTIVGTLTLIVLAPKVRALSNHTIPEMLELRYGRSVRIVATVLILIAFIGITAYQFTGAGEIIALITPLSSTAGTILATLLISFLALSGGLKSVAWTDFISTLMIVFALLAAVGFVLFGMVGGLPELATQLPAEKKEPFGGLPFVAMLGFILPLLLLILGDQNMYQRLGAAKNAAHARNGAIIFFVGSLFMIVPIVLLAVSSSVLQPEINPDTAVLSLSDPYFTPLPIGGMLLGGAFALIVTTGSSYILTCSSNVVHDLVAQLRRSSPPTDAQNLWIGRLAVAGIAVLAFVLVNFFPSVLALQMYAYTMYGVTITPVVIGGLFWKRATGVGALSAMVVGGAATIFWEATGRSADLNSIIVSLPLALLALIIGSLLTHNIADSGHARLTDAVRKAEEKQVAAASR